MSDVVTLYRPTGQKELELVQEAGNLRWPPRLPEQPIFYPVTNEGYAVQIARDWNSKSPERIGHVTAFDVDADYLAKFEKKVVGGREHEEYWVPAEELEEFNDHIHGEIRLVRSFKDGEEQT